MARGDGMRRPFLLAAGAAVFSVAALAATDIPTRYAGSFPSVGRASNITGTFTGSTLVLKGTLIRGTRFVPASGRFACARASSTQTRCNGAYLADDGQSGARGILIVTWSGGRPVAMAFSH